MVGVNFPLYTLVQNTAPIYADIKHVVCRQGHILVCFNFFPEKRNRITGKSYKFTNLPTDLDHIKL